MDLGSGGNAAWRGLAYGLGLNIQQWADPALGAHRDVALAVKGQGLDSFWVFLLCVWNLPHGPDSDDYRFHQIQDATRSCYALHTYQPSPLFNGLLPEIRQELADAGVQLPGEQSVEAEIWGYFSEREFWRRKSHRVNLNRFQGVTAGAEAVKEWAVSLRADLCRSGVVDVGGPQTRALGGQAARDLCGRRRRGQAADFVRPHRCRRQSAPLHSAELGPSFRSSSWPTSTTASFCSASWPRRWL